MPEADTVTIKRPEELSEDMTRADLVEVCQPRLRTTFELVPISSTAS